jgi:trigger factor
MSDQEKGLEHIEEPTDPVAETGGDAETRGDAEAGGDVEAHLPDADSPDQDDHVDEDTPRESETTEEESKEARLLARLKETVTVEREDLGSLRVKLSVTVPREVLEDRFGEEFTELKRDAIVPGFRKGRAPMDLVRKRFASDVGDQLVVQLVSQGCQVAVERETIDPLTDPRVWCTAPEERVTLEGGTRTVTTDRLLPIEQAVEHLRIPKEGPFTFACEVEVRPTFELPDLGGIPIVRPAYQITDEDADRELERFRSMRGTFEPVLDGPIQSDDLMIGEANLTAEGEALRSHVSDELFARDTLFGELRLAGMKDAAVGKHAGDTIELDVTLPDDFDRADLRGKTAHFSFKVTEVKRWVSPPLHAETLQRLGYETEEELRQAIHNSMERRLAADIQGRLRDQIGEYIADHVEMELPPSLSQRATERSIARRRVDLLRRQVPPAEVERHLDESRAQMEQQTQRTLKLSLVLDKIADQREVTVSEEELNGAIAAIAGQQGARFDRVRDQLSRGEGLLHLYTQLRDEKILDQLVFEANITELPVPGAEGSGETAPDVDPADAT